jgi:biotin carboxyl carrier protein
MSIRHRLDKDEVIDRILRDVLILFTAPQRARYLLSPEFAVKIEKQGQPSIQPGDEPIIMSLMKRDTNLVYSSTPGVIYKVYFQQGALVEEGAPLLGICQEENLSYIQQVVNKIKTEWE